MLHSHLFLLAILRVIVAIAIVAAMAASVPCTLASDAYVRVSQVGYEEGHTSRAYLMSTASESGATFKVINSKGKTSFSGKVGARLGIWSHSKSVSYNVYALDFTVPGGDIYHIRVFGPVAASSPQFAVDSPDALYAGLLLNTLFSYETERDGKNFELNALRSAPGHLKDGSAKVYETLNGNPGTFDPSQTALYQDNVQSFSTTEPAIDLTATSFLMWSWRMAGRPSF